MKTRHTTARHKQEAAMTFTSDYMTMLFQVEDHLSRKVAQCVEEAVEQKFRQMANIPSSGAILSPPSEP